MLCTSYTPLPDIYIKPMLSQLVPVVMWRNFTYKEYK